MCVCVCVCARARCNYKDHGLIAMGTATAATKTYTRLMMR
jgi:hypothetical protein